MSITESQQQQLLRMFVCEREFVIELLEEGSTFETAIKLLAKQNETYGKPVQYKFIHPANGKEYTSANWKEV